MGELRVVDDRAASELEVEAELRQLLATLTLFAQSAAPALKLAGERQAVGNLRDLESELQAALIPLNHAAARRAVARLFRETSKVRVERASVISEPVVVPTPSPRPVQVRPPALDLDIDVEFDVEFDERIEAAPMAAARESSPRLAARENTPLPSSPNWESSLPQIPRSEPVAEPMGHRSDLRELLAGFLSHTRCEEHMTADLRRMIGLESGHVRRPASVTPPPLLVAPNPSR